MKKQVKVSSRRNPDGPGRQKFAYLSGKGDKKMKSSAIGRRLADSKSAAQARKEVLAAAGAKKVTEKKEKKGEWIPGRERPTLYLYDNHLKGIGDWKIGQEVVLVLSGKVTSVELNGDDKSGKRASTRVEISEIGTI